MNIFRSIFLLLALFSFSAVASENLEQQKVEDVVGALRFLALKNRNMVIQPTYRHLVRPSYLDSTKLVRGVKNGAIYLVVQVKGKSISLYQQLKNQEDLGTVGNETVT